MLDLFDHNGCAYKVCTQFAIGNNTYDSAFFVACQYSPRGNFNKQKPYTKGNQCTNCPSGYESCDNGLCAAQSSGKTSTKSPPVSTSSSQIHPTPNRTTTSSTTSVSCSEVLAMMALVIANHFK
ncbi:unnamed protein product [Rodentolepis nana]|uniref:SCP domain-containing protein n=1 Tax=Rodentolepis nana TaxID=102285 RepID=A0A3P7RN46_RODNA|nr:unnamed protein product [Rodentolepis nana]